MTPTISEAKAWQPDSLRAAAEAWDSAATDLSREFDVVVQGVDASHDFWVGDAADAARDRAKSLSTEADEIARALVAAAVAAREGSGRIKDARQSVLDTLAAIAPLDYTVADDGTVTPPAQPPPGLIGQASPEVLRKVLRDSAARFTAELHAELDALGAADTDAAHDIEQAFAGAATGDAQSADLGDVSPADWPHMSQDAIATQIAGLTTDQRAQLVADFPAQVGNTDGVPWDLRVAANRLNIAQAIVDERRNLERPADEKALAAMTAKYPGWSPGNAFPSMAAQTYWHQLQHDSPQGREILAAQDAQTKQRIAFYQGLLRDVPDPTGRPGRVQRQVLGFDVDRSSFIELIGDLDTAGHVGVLVPGFNTSIVDSGTNTRAAANFVRAADGDLAMITYLGGPFPQGELPRDLTRAADPSYALDMAPRLVSFSEDVNRTVDAVGLAKGHDIPVTYLGHSYGGSILGTAEAGGLTADRTVYVAAAGAGVDVWSPDDWHNKNPDVERFSMTAPGDPIEWAQDFPFDRHGADPDEMPGVTELDTGSYSDGRLMTGRDAHGDVIDAVSSTAWLNLLAVMTERPFTELPWYRRLTG